MMSGLATINEAVEAMKLGAIDFLTKPLRPGELLEHIERALTTSSHALVSSSGFPLVGESEPFLHVIDQLNLVASMPTTVLLAGETGTGKEMAARHLHRMSVRCRGPFITLHCGAVPDTLLEDELYGHVKGAFTGAVANRIGCFETADGGTLLLDEIGTMSFPLQSKLLRVLQDMEIRRLGDSRSRHVDVRVVAATNANLKELVERGEFRGDLYYRLSVFPITLPALRQRGEDILLLARHFAKHTGIRLGTGPKELTAEAEALLFSCPWPGNVRQLQNVIERAVVICQKRRHIGESDILLDTSPKMDGPAELPHVSIPEKGICFDSVVSQLERQLILQSLEISGGNKKQAAELLQMKRTTLIEKLRRLNPPSQAC